jgi:hypothetical protein
MPYLLFAPLRWQSCHITNLHMCLHAQYSHTHTHSCLHADIHTKTCNVHLLTFTCTCLTFMCGFTHIEHGLAHSAWYVTHPCTHSYTTVCTAVFIISLASPCMHLSACIGQNVGPHDNELHSHLTIRHLPSILVSQCQHIHHHSFNMRQLSHQIFLTSILCCWGIEGLGQGYFIDTGWCSFCFFFSVSFLSCFAFFILYACFPFTILWKLSCHQWPFLRCRVLVCLMSCYWQ